MKYIEEKLNFDIPRSSALESYIPGDDFAVLDIETTGLSPAFGSVVLIGLIICKDGNITLKQFFANSLYDEEEILTYTVKELSKLSYIVTYNGRMFDVPFLQKRCNKYGLELPWLFNVDLFYLFKHYSDLPRFISRLNQKSIEDYAGISGLRQDRISGGESVDLYNQYLETGQKDLERRILLHNSDDVMQLIRLTSLYRNVDMHRAFYKTGFPISGGRITGINQKKNELIINGISNRLLEYVSFPSIERPYHFIMSGKDGSYSLSIPCETKEESTYVDLGFIVNADDIFSSPASNPFYVNKFAILKKNGLICYPMVNTVARVISENILSDI